MPAFQFIRFDSYWLVQSKPNHWHQRQNTNRHSQTHIYTMCARSAILTVSNRYIETWMRINVISKSRTHQIIFRAYCAILIRMEVFARFIYSAYMCVCVFSSVCASCARCGLARRRNDSWNARIIISFKKPNRHAHHLSSNDMSALQCYSTLMQFCWFKCCFVFNFAWCCVCFFFLLIVLLCANEQRICSHIRIRCVAYDRTRIF